MVRAMSEIEFPYMRYSVVEALQSLADSKYQTDGWFLHGNENGDTLGNLVHVLFDDMAGFPHPETMVGKVFFPGEEIERLAELADILNDVIDGQSLEDARLISRDPRWPRVRELAASALVEMLRNGASSPPDR